MRGSEEPGPGAATEAAGARATPTASATLVTKRNTHELLHRGRALAEKSFDLDLDLDLDLISTDKRETARSRPSREGNHGAPSGRRQGL